MTAAPRYRGWAPNAARQKAAGERDAATARTIMDDPEVWTALSQRARLVVMNRCIHPGRTWTELAAALGMTRDTAWGIWRTALARHDVREVLDAAPAARR